MVLANQRPLMPRTSHWLEMVGRVMARSQERAAASAKISALARVGCTLSSALDRGATRCSFCPLTVFSGLADTQPDPHHLFLFCSSRKVIIVAFRQRCK